MEPKKIRLIANGPLSLTDASKSRSESRRVPRDQIFHSPVKKFRDSLRYPDFSRRSWSKIGSADGAGGTSAGPPVGGTKSVSSATSKRSGKTGSVGVSPESGTTTHISAGWVLSLSLHEIEHLLELRDCRFGWNETGGPPANALRQDLSRSISTIDDFLPVSEEGPAGDDSLSSPAIRPPDV